MAYYTNIAKESLANSNFRKVLFTAPHSQLVVMSLLPNEDIGMETHPDNDQFIRIEKGEGKAIMAGVEYPLHDDDVVIIPAGTKHNIINTSATEAMKLYTVYSPFHHPDQTVDETKEAAIKREATSEASK